MRAVLLVCGLVAAQAAGAFAQADGPAFRVSYQAGTTDASGTLMGGTELLNFAVHKGKLYAGLGYWEDTAVRTAASGAQIVVRDGPSAPWRSDHVFPGTLRLNTLRSFAFTTDARGDPVPPADVLLAAPDDIVGGTISVWSRDDVTGRWTKMVLARPGGYADVRALGFHHDAVTGVDYVFAGSNSNARWLQNGWEARPHPLDNTGIFRGVYDQTAPGRIRWSRTPEFTNYTGRPMAFAEADGALYVVARGTMYRRTDGAVPTWTPVFSVRDRLVPKNSGLRGLTAIPNPSGPGEALLVTLEGPTSRAYRIDPAANYRTVVELDIAATLRARWHLRRDPYVIAAYNDMPAMTEPRSGRPVMLLGLQAHDPAPGHADSTWYLVRREDASYSLREVAPIPDPLRSNAALVAVRAIAVSPFPSDAGQFVYLGGYDCNFIPAHDTAWMYQTTVGDLIGPPGPR